MKKNFLLSIASGLILLLSLSCKNSNHDKDITIASTILHVSGSVTVSGPLYSQTPAKPGTPFNQGNTVSTEGKSTALFQMGDEALIKILENTSVSLVKVESKQRTLEINSGILLGKVRKINKNDGFLIRLPDMVASVRGTDFLITIKGKKVSVSVADGKVAIAPDESTLQSPAAVIVESGRTCYAESSDRGILKTTVSESGNGEMRLLDTIGIIPFVKSAEKKSGKEINAEIAPYAEKTPEPRSGDPTSSRQKILLIGRASLIAIKDAFNRIDEITLYSNRVLSGIIVSRGETFDVITPEGRFKISQRDIKATKVIR
jgi:hypothetical protein